MLKKKLSEIGAIKVNNFREKNEKYINLVLCVHTLLIISNVAVVKINHSNSNLLVFISIHPIHVSGLRGKVARQKPF